MEAILVELALAGISGGVPAVGTFLSGLSVASWVTLAEGVGGALEPSVAARLGLVHPSLQTLVEKVVEGVGAKLATEEARAWFTMNGDEAIKLQQARDADA